MKKRRLQPSKLKKQHLLSQLVVQLLRLAISLLRILGTPTSRKRRFVLSRLVRTRRERLLTKSLVISKIILRLTILGK